MHILRNILALLLAFQVINPMCSCAEPSNQDNPCCEPAPTTTPSCCAETQKDQDDSEPAPDNQHLCLCPSDPQNTQDVKTVIPSPHATILPELLATDLPTASPGHTLMPVPARTEHHPPGRPIRIIYSIFRL